MDIPLKKSKSKAVITDDFSVNEEEFMDVSCFTDGEAKLEGTLLKSFSFTSDDELIEVPINLLNSSNADVESFNLNKAPNQTHNENYIKNEEHANADNYKNSISTSNKNNLPDHRTLKANPNGRTPPVDGEIFDMLRTYSLRRSTVRILSKIKAIHSDDNVYLNTIVDEAIRYYYEYLKDNLKE